VWIILSESPLHIWKKYDTEIEWKKEKKVIKWKRRKTKRDEDEIANDI
jgi:hypothetical protein